MLKRHFSVALILAAVLASLIVGSVSTAASLIAASSRVETIIRGELEQTTYINEIRAAFILQTLSFLGEILSDDYFEPNIAEVLTSPGVGTYQSAESINEFLTEQTKRNQFISGVAVVSDEGTILAASMPSIIGRQIDFRDLSLKAIGGGNYVSTILDASKLDKFPWETSKVAFATNLHSDLSLKILVFSDNQMLESVPIEGTRNSAERIYFDEDMAGIYSSAETPIERFLATKRGAELLGRIKSEIDDAAASGQTTIREIEMGQYAAYIKPTQKTATTAVVIFNKMLYRQYVAQSAWPAVIAFSAVTLVAFYASQSYARKKFEPFEQIVMPTLFSVASGDKYSAIDYRSNNEIGVLARVYNELREELLHKDRELKEAEMRFSLLVEQKEDIIFEWDAKQDTVELAPEFAEKFGFMPNRYEVSRHFIDEQHIHSEDLETSKLFFQHAFSQTESAKAVFRIRRVDGVYLWVDARVSALYDENEQFYGTIGVLSDINDLKTQEYRLAERIRIDALSSVYSRPAFETYARELVAEHQPSCKVDTNLDADAQTSTVALVFLDIDNFKHFNTVKGHAYGDRVIRYLGGVLNEVVEGYGVAGRVGGDEFALALELGAQDPTAYEIVESLRARLAQGMKSRSGEAPTIISVSVGFAFCPINGSSYEELMQHADLEMLGFKQRAREELNVEALRALEDVGAEEAT